jgi:hypothetical protein
MAESNSIAVHHYEVLAGGGLALLFKFIEKEIRRHALWTGWLRARVHTWKPVRF